MNLINLKSLSTFLIFIIISFTFFSCSSGEEFATPEAVIEANAKYMTAENFDKVMNTIDQNSPVYVSTEATIQKLFDQYDLNYTVISMKIIEEATDEAKVEFVQETIKIKGPAFRNNRVTGIHTLKKVGKSWKIYNTEITNVNYLN